MNPLIKSVKSIYPNTIRRLHDRKLPSVINKKINEKSQLVGTQSPRKANYNKDIKKENKDTNCDSNKKNKISKFLRYRNKWRIPFFN